MQPVSRRRAAAMLGSLAFLVSAAPDDDWLAFDPSAFAQASCLAPSFAEDGCFYAGMVAPAGGSGLSASAALLDPRISPEREPSLPAHRAVRLEADLSGLFDFGPEVVHRVPPRRQGGTPPLRIAAGSERMMACNAAGRHRPDRSNCAKSASGRRR